MAQKMLELLMAGLANLLGERTGQAIKIILALKMKGMVKDLSKLTHVVSADIVGSGFVDLAHLQGHEVIRP